MAQITKDMTIGEILSINFDVAALVEFHAKVVDEAFVNRREKTHT